MQLHITHNRIIAKQFRKLLQTSLLLLLIASCVKGNGRAAFAPSDTIVISKLLVSKKYKIEIYPGAGSQYIFFTANGDPGKVYQLYVFDFDGNLVKQTQIRNRETTLLTRFNKGNYSFDVFSDDERIENGTMSVH